MMNPTKTDRQHVKPNWFGGCAERVKQQWRNNSEVRMLEVQGPKKQRGVAGGNKQLQSKQTDDESSLFEVEVVLEQVVR